MERATVLETEDGIKAHCLAPVDLCLCKLLAGRPKDLSHIAGMLESGLVGQPMLRDYIRQVGEIQPKVAERQMKTLETVLGRNPRQKG